MASNPGESAEKSQNKEIAKHATESTNSTISSVYYAPEIRMRHPESKADSKMLIIENCLFSDLLNPWIYSVMSLADHFTTEFRNPADKTRLALGRIKLYFLYYESMFDCIINYLKRIRISRQPKLIIVVASSKFISSRNRELLEPTECVEPYSSMCCLIMRRISSGTTEDQLRNAFADRKIESITFELNEKNEKRANIIFTSADEAVHAHFAQNNMDFKLFSVSNCRPTLNFNYEYEFDEKTEKLARLEKKKSTVIAMGQKLGKKIDESNIARGDEKQSVPVLKRKNADEEKLEETKKAKQKQQKSAQKNANIFSKRSHRTSPPSKPYNNQYMINPWIHAFPSFTGPPRPLMSDSLIDIRNNVTAASIPSLMSPYLSSALDDSYSNYSPSSLNCGHLRRSAVPKKLVDVRDFHRTPLENFRSHIPSSMENFNSSKVPQVDSGLPSLLSIGNCKRPMRLSEFP
ncbi:unnamed protein product [Dracunculus medinensis]|uniref:RRM domain-containing protein n=1 Tax=Dracunculus medinensis TaxID=318479 RepID=A0A0N4UGK6_DRAME|nr:unnamed protein product [Dracunculus medinensis]